MPEPVTQPRVVRFGVFEADLASGELRRNGVRIRLQVQPFQILAALLDPPGELVRREDLRLKLWTANTFVDFEHGLNNAVNRLREALGDSAEAPRFIETLPRRGYRFIAPVETVGAPPLELACNSSGQPTAMPAARLKAERVPQPVPAGSFMRRVWLGVGACAALASLLIVANMRGWRERLLGKSNAAPIHSVAVLPLQNLTGDATQDYVADGMTNGLIADLTQIDAVRVVSRASAVRYKGTRKTLPEIARELNVDAVVEGAVLHSTGRVLIKAELIRGETGQRVWAGEFEGDLPDVARMQGQVARAIAAQIRPPLAQPRAQPSSARAISPSAYEDYLQGRDQLFECRTRGGCGKAIRYFEMAIAKAPNFAPAYAGLASCHLWAFSKGEEPSPQEAWSNAATAAQKALQLDDQLAEAHIAMADVRFRLDWNWPEADREYKRGLELNPSDALGHAEYSVFLAVMGRSDQAFAEATRARGLDPFSPLVSNSVSWVYTWSHKYDKAIAESDRTLRLDPYFTEAHHVLEWNYLEKGMYAQAVSEGLKWRALKGDSPEEIQSLRGAYAASGIKGFWEESAKWNMRKLSLPEPPYMELARACVHAGQRDEAFRWLERAYETRYPFLPNVNVVAWANPLRSDPRFADLMHRVGFPPMTLR